MYSWEVVSDLNSIKAGNYKTNVTTDSYEFHRGRGGGIYLLKKRDLSVICIPVDPYTTILCKPFPRSLRSDEC